MQRQDFLFEKLPDEIILHCASFNLGDISSLLAFNLISRRMHGLSMERGFWVAACQQHQAINALVEAIMGKQGLKDDDLDVRTLYLSVYSQNPTQKIQALFKPYKTIQLYYPTYEDSARRRPNLLLFQNTTRLLYLNSDIAMRTIPNIGSVKGFVQLILPLQGVDFRQLANGKVGYGQPIPDKAIVKHEACPLKLSK